MSNDYLIHHGIKGQRWGVRRFQNEDGTRTAAGLRRYSVGSLRGKTPGYQGRVMDEAVSVKKPLSANDVRDKVKKFQDRAKSIAQKVKQAIDETEGYEDETEKRSSTKSNKMSRDQKFSVHKNEVKEIRNEMDNDDEFNEKIQRMRDNGAQDWQIESARNRELERRLDKRVSESISMQMDREFAEAFNDYGDDGEDWFKSKY